MIRNCSGARDRTQLDDEANSTHDQKADADGLAQPEKLRLVGYNSS